MPVKSRKVLIKGMARPRGSVCYAGHLTGEVGFLCAAGLLPEKERPVPVVSEAEAVRSKKVNIVAVSRFPA